MEVLGASDPVRIGPYEILGVLGSGGMGRVYLGRSAAGALAAVKVVHADLARDAEFRARFRREVAATVAVSGPYVAQVVHADVEAERPWLATEYVEGPSLADELAARGALPEAEVAALGRQLASGLAAIHAAGLVHRDVKPSNILLAAGGPKLIDFGIARDAAASKLTRTGVSLGTPQFMAPEQIQGEGPSGPAADVFALAGVLVHAATGGFAFGEGSAVQLLYRIVQDEPRLEQVPSGLRELLAACLDKDPARRPSMRELAEALSQAGGLEARVLPSGLDSVRYLTQGGLSPWKGRGRSRGRKNSNPYILAAAGSVVGIAALVIALTGGGSDGTVSGSGGHGGSATISVTDVAGGGPFPPGGGITPSGPATPTATGPTPATPSATGASKSGASSSPGAAHTSGRTTNPAGGTTAPAGGPTGQTQTTHPGPSGGSTTTAPHTTSPSADPSASYQNCLNHTRTVPCVNPQQDGSTYILRNLQFNSCVGQYTALDNCSSGATKFHQTWGEGRAAVHFESATYPGQCLAVRSTSLVPCNINSASQWFGYQGASFGILLSAWNGGTTYLVADQSAFVAYIDSLGSTWPPPSNDCWSFQ